MPKRLTNKKKWKADLLILNDDSVDEDDRPIIVYEFKRVVFYNSLGITSTEKYQSRQDKREVVKRIKISMDRSITETNNRIKILDVVYQITRIFWNEDDHEMELSLAHVD